jgi:hypothetical protein
MNQANLWSIPTRFQPNPTTDKAIVLGEQREIVLNEKVSMSES